ncbi:MFS transporter [Pseudoxanthomonas sp. JBR18]|uniref:MFS transporter n=1 Tax=Pseudoxanthomonas sp. JBR18 TaxID=2969308 RepID=UPI002305A821|nr:MFS transporter [Pseudoxanthomonas sp. JBR18]WCE06234.1 MFS transporter [Pseudoxanthomonas sp. JBR18]
MDNQGEWDTRYEWKAVVLLALGFGLVGVDRFLILPMFPVMMKELHLGYADLGHITGILAITWGIASLFMGRLADRVGRIRVVVWSMVAFSLLAGFSGLVHGLVGLLIIRALLGFAEGAYTPPSITATLEASKPTRHGLNLGLQQAAMPLFGLAIAPIIVTQLRVMDWRWIFFLVSVPGLIVALLLRKTLRESAERRLQTVDARLPAMHGAPPRWNEILRYRNVPLNMLGMLCWLTCLMVSSALMPNYLMDHLHLTLQQMGLVMSALGFGATLGTIVMPALSDRLGRKPVMLVSVLAAIGFMIALIQTGADPLRLFGLLFGTCFFNFALICLTVGPLTAEAVPAELRASASGAVVGVGEIFGGGIAPAIGGYIAAGYGIQYIPWLAIGGLILGIGVVIFLKETAPAPAPPKVIGALS